MVCCVQTVTSPHRSTDSCELTVCFDRSCRDSFGHHADSVRPPRDPAKMKWMFKEDHSLGNAGSGCYDASDARVLDGPVTRASLPSGPLPPAGFAVSSPAGAERHACSTKRPMTTAA
ncbi:hypothetical protein EYF80_053721 [Liparis tanakae]|uniref:Uncharacterized protein n=1 Tax=Liparis tanakae TaxID=230148 RepID=A0A4Z2F4S3_9TELE|nr:hypothetical protein EYF80_053721 [Liparis tanakae]